MKHAFLKGILLVFRKLWRNVRTLLSRNKPILNVSGEGVQVIVQVANINEGGTINDTEPDCLLESTGNEES